MTLNEIFSKKYEEIDATLTYLGIYADHNGYLTKFVDCTIFPNLKPNDFIKCITYLKRRIIILGTLKGNVVIYDKYHSNHSEMFLVNLSADLLRNPNVPKRIKTNNDLIRLHDIVKLNIFTEMA